MRDGGEGDGILIIPICRSWAYRLGLELFLKRLMGLSWGRWLLSVEADGWKPRFYVEAGTGFLDTGKVAMAYDAGIGVVEAEAP